MDNPCRYCVAPRRHVGCHGSCKDRKEWKEEHDRKIEIERLENVAWVDDVQFSKRNAAYQNMKDNKKRK
jgi:hypothetical protein